MIMFHENSATRILYQKVAEMSAEAMHKTLEDYYNNNAAKDFFHSWSERSNVLDNYGDDDCNSLQLGSNFSSEREVINQKPVANVKKCLSLATGLDLKAMAFNDSEDESWQRSSLDDSKDFETSLTDNKVAGPSESSQMNSDLVNNESSSVLSNGSDQKLPDIDETCDSTLATQHEERDDNMQKNYKITGVDDHTHNCAESTKDWTEQTMLDELHSNDFRLRRIEKWVSELQNSGCFEEPNVIDSAEKDESVIDSTSPVAKVDEMISPGKEAVKKYLSSLSCTATFAQLVNRGLVVIPFLSAVTSLRSLDLRGNAIGTVYIHTASEPV